ncbi:MAG: transporter [Gammaproteobacteria bacterium]|nr:transporter [Gammaproteobacteria bacterium]
MKWKNPAQWLFAIIALTFITPSIMAHDPIFGIGPHVLYKGGIEISPEFHRNKKGPAQEDELGLGLTYGITGDWSAGVELPYTWADNGTNSNNGTGDIRLFTKYRFWRNDQPGIQESAAILLKTKTNTGSNTLSSASANTLGLTYGFEGRSWYRWASLRYQANNKDSTGLKHGNKILIDLVAGVRPNLTGYLEPDTVWLLELNGEYAQQTRLNGTAINNSGGNEWFLSPGIFWTQRNFAVKAAIQVPISSNLKGVQDKTDYRAKLILEWHM